MSANLHNLAAVIDKAAFDAKATQQLSTAFESFSEKEAYDIQKTSIARRLERGEKMVGLKLGFTSRAKMIQMGVHDMIWGRLTDKMILEEGDSLDLNNYIHPRAEPEICFLVKKKIDRQLSALEVVDYLDGIAPAIEVIDSRYENFKFSLEDVIADNCSSAGFVVGEWFAPNTDIRNLGMVLEFDQRPVQVGSSAAILGNPIRSMVAMSRLAVQYEQEIPAGTIILAGAATPAVFLTPGIHVRARFEKLGNIGFSVK